MPRLLTGQELFKSLDTLSVFRQVSGGGSTTVSTLATAGATAVGFTATTNFTAADPIILVGSTGTELNAIGGAVTPTTAVPIAFPLAMQHPVAAQILEAVETVLGHIEQAGLSFTGQAPLAPVFSALQHAPITYLRGFGEQQVSFSLQGFNPLNLQSMFGITEAEGGAGSLANPYRGVILGQNIGTQGIQCLRATGTRMDGSVLILDFTNGFIEPSGPINMSRGVVTSMPCNLRFQNAILRQYSV